MAVPLNQFMKDIKSISNLEQSLLWHIQAFRLPDPILEHAFHPKRRWRFDFAWPERKVAVEVEGGTWSDGRHTTGSGFEKDCEKYNQATLLGWKVFRFTSGMIESGEAIKLIQEILEIN